MERPLADRFWEKVQKTKTCWLWTGANLGGKWPYGMLGKPGDPTVLYKAHRLSWELHVGPIPDGLFVLHKCDVPLCVNPDHLFLGTAADNMADMVQKGRARGGRPKGARLSPASLASFREKRKYKP